MTSSTSKQLDAEFSSAFFGQERVVADDFHFEGQRPLGERQADSSQPDHGQCFSGKLRAGEFFAVPAAGFHRGSGLRNVPRQRRHQSKSQFRRAGRVSGRRVHHDDAFASGRIEIDIVDSDARSNDDLQARLTG